MLRVASCQTTTYPTQHQSLEKATNLLEDWDKSKQNELTQIIFAQMKKDSTFEMLLIKTPKLKRSVERARKATT